MNLITNWDPIISILVFIVSSILALFLYYRTGRHELVDDEILFDSSIIGLIGALVGGRITDFALRPDFYGFSLSKLFFFNVYGGFDWYGAILGLVVAIFLLLRKRNINFWFILDLISVPLVFAAILVSIANYLIFNSRVALIYAVVLLIIFWTLKRLAKIKRNYGFFFSTVLILVSLLNISMFRLVEAKYKVFGKAEYNLLLPIFVLIVSTLLFYLLSARKFKDDLKNLMGLIILGLFKLKRILTSFSEANQVARVILLSPLYLSKFTFDLVKLVGKEIQLSLSELAQVFGVRK